MTGFSTPTDLIVVGGGVIGLAAAHESARRGLHVTVLERAVPGRGSSWAAAGMLSPLSAAGDAGPFLDFGLESLRMYRTWVDTLEAETGFACEYREAGKLHLARSEEESARMEERLGRARARGLRVDRMDAKELTDQEPALSESIVSGIWVHDDYRLDNRRLMDALIDGCVRAGVDIRPGRSVDLLRIENSRIRGVGLSDGEQIDGGAVLVAAGAWSGSLGGLPVALGVKPIRGQMLALAPSMRVSTRVLESESVYLVPREDGRLLVGATVEDVGPIEANTADGTRTLLEAAIALVPSLRSSPVVELWSGLRPGTEDGDPIIGPDPHVEGLFYATGHFRNGILLAPITARIVSALVTGQEPHPIPPQFAPGRMAPAGPSIPST